MHPHGTRQSECVRATAEPPRLHHTHGAPWHEATCHGISKSRHQAAAEGMCLPGGRAGTTKTQSLINGREMLFPFTSVPRSSVFSTSYCPPLFPVPSSTPVCSSPSTSMQQQESDCLSQGGLCCCTGEGASLGLASLIKLPLEAVTGETLTNVGTRVWGSRWSAGSQVNKLCTLDVELDGSTVGSLPCLLCTMSGFCPIVPLQRDKLALG